MKKEMEGGRKEKQKNTPREFSGSIASHKNYLTTAIRQKTKCYIFKLYAY